jgi:cytochrome c biogenesis protein CcmG/thiol:disulfide interchange protein DsbE
MKWLNRIFGGPGDMAALAAGTRAPEIALPVLNGGNFSLQEALKRGPVVAAFFKVSCPVCQYAFPFLERLHKAYGNKNVTIVGISQDNARDTASFMKEFGVTFPVLLEDPSTYAVSNAYGLTNVPSVFLIAPDGEIEMSIVGWVKQEYEDLNRRLANAQKAPLGVLFNPAEQVQDFRAG